MEFSLKESLAEKSFQHPLIQQFLREKAYLKGIRPATIRYYRTLFRSYFSITEASTEVPTKVHLTAWMIGMRERQLRPATINTMVIAMNAYTRWLLTEGHILTSVKLGKVQTGSHLLRVVTQGDMEKLVLFKPSGWRKQRVHLAALTVLDTGLRLNEILTLSHPKIDYDQLLFRVTGKGDKERLVPFSPELRKLLLKWQALNDTRYPSPLVFPPQYEHSEWSRDNAQRAMYALWRGLGCKPPYGWHVLRHTFATEYLRNGGDIVRLSKILGHASITTTQVYEHLLGDDLGLHHAKVSILHRLRRKA